MKKSLYLTGKKVLKGTKLQRIRISNVVPPHNVLLQEGQSQAILRSLKNYGWIYRPLLGYRFRGKVYCITGSHRIKVARHLKMKTVPVFVISSESLKQLKSLGFAGNGRQRKMIDFFYSQGVFSDFFKKSPVPRHYLKYIDFDQSGYGE